ncbi:hypothetical protein ACM66Z_04835 [Sulfurovum sp. ST-21]|uniref:YbbD head domain-containing protein n=1 Tax=Sulfurovum indicum TaxID=2779528 RepID=A0A7M1S6Q2_9BACT|nr:hypothetical protein [Sulfurovum indicum]QOR62792.1 hypothetical protein IMZ28_04805 [Sulfurovum indicum]
MKKIIFAILLFFIVVYFMLTRYFSDVTINKYLDKQTVLQEQAIEKGWVPAILPESAYDIEETHDPDTNTLFGRFYYKEQDEEKVLQKLTPVRDMNQTYEWGDYLFKIDTEKNQVKYRNKTTSA